ncbi:MAG: hypothetical protein QF362_01590 [Candidatus Woesearchaeota archaeon]|nr:hypothetical protein [Candidatus Woesearchaeota archaeon]
MKGKVLIPFVIYVMGIGIVSVTGNEIKLVSEDEHKATEQMSRVSEDSRTEFSGTKDGYSWKFIDFGREGKLDLVEEGYGPGRTNSFEMPYILQSQQTFFDSGKAGVIDYVADNITDIVTADPSSITTYQSPRNSNKSFKMVVQGPKRLTIL